MGNILWGIRTDCTEEITSLRKTHSKLGFPKRIRFDAEWKTNGKPSEKWLELVQPVEFPTSWLSNKVYLTDFGTTFRAGTKVESRLQGVMSFCSPERFYGQDPSPASDMWSFGLVFFYLYTGKVPSRGRTAGDCLSDMVNGLGPLPAEWKGRFTEATQPDATWYDPHNRSLPKKERTLEKIIRDDLRGLEGAERLIKLRTEKHVLAIIKKVFAYLPEHRPTASQLLQDPDFRKLLEIYDVQGEKASVQSK